MIDHLTPDLDNPILGLLIAALFAWVVLAVVWMHEHRAAVARVRRILLARMGRTSARAEAHDAARLGRRVRRDHGSKRRSGRARAAHPLELTLTDDEAVALARWVELRWVSADEQAVLHAAIDKLDRVALRLIQADRAGRRRP